MSSHRLLQVPLPAEEAPEGDEGQAGKGGGEGNPLRTSDLGPQTDEHDYQFKLKHAREFLEEGNKVRAYVFFRGRSILFKEQGEVLLLRFANDLEEVGKVESMPSLEGKKMFLYLAPKKAGAQKKSQQARDREAAEQEAKEAAKQQKEAAAAEAPANGGLLANAKISADALKKLTEEK